MGPAVRDERRRLVLLRATGSRLGAAATSGRGIEFASPEVLDWLRSLQPDFKWVWVEQEIDTALRNGHIFPLVTVDGVKAGYIKVGLGKAYVTDFNRELSIPSGSAFIYDAFVHPEFRGRGVARWARAETMRWLQQHGTVRIWSHIPSWNRAAIAMVKSCGCRRVAFVRHARWLRWHLYSRDPERLLVEAGGPDLAQTP